MPIEPTDKAINDYFWNRYGTKAEKQTHEQKMMEQFKEVKRDDKS